MVARNVLITGFEPFGGEKLNPSELVARKLEGRLTAGRPLRACVLPVDTNSLRVRLARAIELAQPDIVVCSGLAGGTNAIAIERVAVNVLEFKQPDNSGVLRRNEPVEQGGPDARLSTLPCTEIVRTLTEGGIPAYVSNSAGTYLCNQALYEALGIAERSAQPFVAGFVHLPYLPEQAAALGAEGTPSMALELMVRGMEILIETVVSWVEDRHPALVALAQRK